MADISAYIIKVVCAAVFCGVLNRIVKGNGTVSSIIKTISGIFIAVTILSPLVNIQLDRQIGLLDDYFQMGMQFSSDGEQIGAQQKSEIIKSYTQTYILDKAISFGAELEVEVVLSSDEDNPYKKVMLRGDISPYARDRLSQMIADELGIPEEAQQWNN